MSQAGYTPIQLYHSTTASAVPSAGNLANGEPALNITDGKLYYKNNSGVVTLLASAAGASGDVVGPGSSTDNALVRFDTTTGKLVQNSVGILSDAGALSGLTDISASGSVTLSGGTANGVPYLNGSKVLTTGSALTFDGTNLGIGTASPNAKLVVAGGSEYITNTAGNSAGIEIAGNGNTPTTNSLFIGQGSTSLAFIYQRANADMLFGINNSEQMRLTSTGLGIGTSSPSAKLDIQGGNIVVGTTTAGNSTASMTFGKVAAGGGTISNRISLATYGGLYGAYMEAYADLNASTATYLAFGTQAGGGGTPTERMRLDSSGNLGLGVTPSAWFATSRILQIGSGGAIESRTNFNPYISTTSNAYLDTAGTYRYIGSAEAGRYLQDSGTHKFYTAPSGTAGNAISFTQVLTVAADGKATSTAAGVDNNFTLNSTAGAYSTTLTLAAAGGGGSTINATGASSDYLRFTITGTERARIDSSGNLLVGTTSGTNARLYVVADGGATTPFIINNTASGTSESTLAIWRRNGTNTGSISITGSLTLYNTTSDYRLKTVLGPVSDAGSRIDALEPVEYEWKVDGSRTRGFLAHKFQEVYAGSVTGSKDAVDEKGKPVYQAMQASSSEVIADLVAEIQSLRKRLAAAGI